MLLPFGTYLKGNTMTDEKYGGLISDRVSIVDQRTKDYVGRYLKPWRYVELTEAEWFAALENGYAILVGEMKPTPDGSYTHKKEYWVSTYHVFTDADRIKGVEFDKDTGEDVNPDGVEPWTKAGQLSKKFPGLLDEAYAVSESVNSMLKEPPHRRNRVCFKFDKPITCPIHYKQIIETLSGKYPIISTEKRSPTQPVFGNARKGFNKVYVNGKVLKLSDYPFIDDKPKPTEKRKQSHKPASDQKISLRDYLTKHGISWTAADAKAVEYPEAVFVECPGKNKHTNPTAADATMIYNDKKDGFTYACMHRSCGITGWQDYRAAVNLPEPKAKPSSKSKRKPNPVAEAKDASDYFIGDKDFNVLAMSEFIQEQFIVWAQDSGIYIYNDKTGIYERGEIEIDKAVREELQELRKKTYTEEVFADLRACCRREPSEHDLIAFRNGVVSLPFDEEQTEGELLEHSPDNYLMRVFPIDFNPELGEVAGATDFFDWLKGILGDDEGLLNVVCEIIGSIFHRGSVDMQKGVLFIGEGGTGKSMLLETIERMVGRENICARAWSDFGDSDFAFGDLYEKALALDSDIQVDKPSYRCHQACCDWQ